MTRLFRFFLLLAGLLLGQQRPGAAQVFEWARLAQNSTIGAYTTKASATDAAGNTYLSAQFTGTLLASGQTLTNASGPGSALLKYDAAGKLIWAQALSGIVVEQLAVDPANGGLFAAGQIQSSANWSGQPVSISGPFFYAKVAAGGALQWITSLADILSTGGTGSTRNRQALRLAADGLGNGYLMGILRSPGNVAGVALDNQTAFLLQFTASGANQWVRQLHGSAASTSWVGPAGIINANLVGKPGGGCLVLGQIRDIIYFGPGTSAPSLSTVGSGRDGMLADYDATGTLRWSRLVSGPSTGFTSPYLNAGAVDAAGNCYITGGSPGAMTFGPSSTTTRGFALAKYDAAGTLQWLQTQQPGTGIPGWGEGMQVVVDPAGTELSVMVQDSSWAYGPQGFGLQLGTLRTASINSIVRYDGQGQPQWIVGETMLTLTPPATFAASGLGRDNAGNLYWAGAPQTTFWNRTPSVPLSTMLGAHTLVGSGIVLSKLQTQANSLTGEVYRDLNGNGQRDAGEPVYTASTTAQLTQNSADSFFPVRNDGQLQAFAGTGSYSLTLATGTLPRYYAITQPAGGSYTGSFSGLSQTQSGRVFGVGPIANQPDVRISLTPYTPVRPGFLTRYRLTVENMGTTTAAGTVTASLDGRLTYVSSAPAGTLSGNTLTWSYSNLLPQATLNYDLQFSLPINVTLGTLLTHTAAATLTGDLTPADNTTSLQQTVVGSFDPNDISVDYTELTTQQVAARQRLLYRVRFQNMGTDTAFFVTIKDTLDASRLQVSSLRMVSQSHNCFVETSNRGVLTIRLINPKLPPRSTNVLGSQGYILFEAAPLRTLAPGDVIPNYAHITFDYNAPLRTNTATTTVMQPLATRPGQVALSWDAYPNPATDALTISLPANTTATAELLDALGRPVRQQALTGATSKLDLRTLPAGLYLLRLRTPQGYTTGRSIIRQ